MSSSDLENITQHILQQKTQSKKNKKQTQKKQSRLTPVAEAAHAKNEGDDPHWAYAPPEGAVLLDHSVDVGPFEWEALKDDEDTEIWLVRVPDTVRPKHLQGLDIDPASSSSRTARIGCLTRKSASYDVWSIGHDHDHADADANDEGAEDAVAGAEELRGLACLLPRKRKHGKLYLAPKQVSRHIVVSTRPSIATPDDAERVVYQNPPRRAYPKDVLTHAFVPYGARSEQSRETRSEDVSMDVEDIEATRDAAPTDHPAKPPKESKAKKRKGDGDPTPKKSKKHKA
ncbi:hypothetical protein OG21DRAFT_1420722 [Imleria badia]|nr:hypothetical protein OG21DRAFT_1420722 [Imleria badia]